MYLLHASMRCTHARRQVEITEMCQASVVHYTKAHSPVTRMKSVPFRLSMLDLDRKAHHYSPTQIDSPVNKFNGAELHIANATDSSDRARCKGT